MRCSARCRFSLLAATPNAAAMYPRPSFRGGWSNRSGFSDPPNDRERGRQIVTGGDPHFHALHDQNLGFRHGTFVNPAGFHPQPYCSRAMAHSNHNQFRYPPPGAQIRQAFQVPQHQSRPGKPLDYRNWEYAKTAKTLPNSERFIVLSYNILADCHVIDHWSQLYFHIPRHMLDWLWRKRSIMFELGLWSADIMCFQEVDRFYDLEELKYRGYCGIWKRRTGNAVDGCAIFWRTSRFKLVHEESIEFNKLGLRDNVAQICVLELTSKNNTKNIASQSPTSSEDSNKVVVCNIHVLFNPKRGDIKLGQVRVLLHKAHAVSKLWRDAPIVLCGDFNCTPQSPLYNYILEQKIDLSKVNRYKVSGQADAENSPQRLHIHHLRDQSADSSIQPPRILEAKEVPRIDTNSLNSPNSMVSSSDRLCKSETFDSTEVSSHSSLEKISSESNGSSTSHQVDVFDVKMENLSLNEQHGNKIEGKSIVKDDQATLSTPHNNADAQLQSPSYEVPNDKKSLYDPPMWTPVDTETATGEPDCTILEHPIKLRSSYTEVEDCSGTRDSSGEPMATSYHRSFLGTVDYIWRSEGLQTVRVLAPIPKHVMQQTPGFPTKKWGSDHIALASEFVFTKGINKEAP